LRRKPRVRFLWRQEEGRNRHGHIGALPGTPRRDEKGGMAKLIEIAGADREHRQEGGVDAVMFGNENDRPYSLKAPTASVAAMSAVIATLRHKSGLDHAMPNVPGWRLARIPQFLTDADIERIIGACDGERRPRAMRCCDPSTVSRSNASSNTRSRVEGRREPLQGRAYLAQLGGRGRCSATVSACQM
jgi:hypothetical protein